jgi:hypothetical protein
VLLVASVTLLACGDNDAASNQNQNRNQNHATPICGNAELEGLEACDDGAQNSDTRSDACRTDCTLARCGDGLTGARASPWPGHTRSFPTSPPTEAGV